MKADNVQKFTRTRICARKRKKSTGFNNNTKNKTTLFFLVFLSFFIPAVFRVQVVLVACSVDEVFVSLAASWGIVNPA
jgi:hypothetical protein